MRQNRAMPRLTPDETTAVLKRHQQMRGGVLRLARLRYETALHPPTPDLVVQLDAPDLDSSSGWCRMSLTLEGVATLWLREDEATNMVLLGGLAIVYAGDRVYVDFSPPAVDGYDLTDFSTSTFSVSAKALWVQVSPLDAAVPDPA